MEIVEVPVINTTDKLSVQNGVAVSFLMLNISDCGLAD